MGSCFGSDNRVLDEMETDGENYASFGEFKRLRSCTDKIPLIGMGIFFGVLFVCIAIAMANGDISRFINGYDDCGNVCGKVNHKFKDSPVCFGQDMTDKKYLLTKLEKGRTYNYTTKTCVHDCKESGGFVLFLNRCFVKGPSSNSTEDVDVGGNFLQSVSEDFQQVWGQIIIMSLLALVFSIIMVILLRYATAFVVWFVLIGMTAILIGGTLFFWILYKNANDDLKKSSGFNRRKEDDKSVFLYCACAATCCTFIMLFIILIFFKRIKLVIQLFKEAAKAIAAMPLLIFQPLWTFCALFVIFVSGCYFSMWITSYANLTKDNMKPGYHDNNPDALMYQQTTMSWITSGLNWFGILWMIQFVVGCQHLIVGGCVATWFFARNKDNLGSPITYNTTNLVKYHLGTVAFGSLIITIVEIIKQMVRCLRQSLNARKNLVAVLLLCIFGALLEWIEAILKFFSRNAYIMTAIYGYTFCQGGKKAFRLLMNNIFSVVAINSVGDYVLSFMKLFIVLFTTLIGYEVLRTKELHFIWFPLIVIGLIAFFIAHCFVTIFEMAIDTIFLCFCEDCEQNDGLSKPYYMSRNLMEFVENSSKVMKTPWEAEQLQAWENGPRRILQQGS